MPCGAGRRACSRPLHRSPAQQRCAMATDRVWRRTDDARVLGETPSTADRGDDASVAVAATLATRRVAAHGEETELGAAEVLALQRTLGNAATASLLSRARA